MRRELVAAMEHDESNISKLRDETAYWSTMMAPTP
jgi:hypothetical protein